MSAVLKIISLWRAEALYLGLGAVLSLGALGAGAALMRFSGHTIAAAMLGGVVLVPVALQAAGAARGVLRYLERVCTHSATFRALARLRLWFFAGLARGAAGGLGFVRTGDAMARLVNDVDALDGLYLRITVPVLGAVLLLPILAWVLWREAPAALLLLLPFGFIAFYLPVLAARAAMDGGARAGLAIAGLRNAALDALSGLREVKIFAAEGRMLAAVQAREADLLAAQRGLAARSTALNAVAFCIAQGAILLAMVLGFAGAPVAAIVAVFVLIIGFETVLGLPRAGLLFGQAAAAAARVVAVAQQAPSLAEPAHPAPMPPGNALAFEQVKFRYAPNLPYLFENLSLQLPAGSRSAILGPSGAGKSTIAALLLKIIAPESGQIRLGGADYATLPAEAVRARIAYLSQTTHLFSDTIRNNLALGAPGADDATLWAALDAAQLAATVRALPEGLGSWVGEGGQNFSGGQGRRLALARTLLSPAPILLLDEPCAGLDGATALEFMKVLNAATTGRTVVLILHRLTGAEQLDRIWRLTGGMLVSAAG